MIDYFKCIKTGCDVLCGDSVYHGDLFHHNGVFLLKSSDRQYGRHLFHHFEVESIIEMPINNPVFMLFGKVSNVHQKFLSQITTYESASVQDVFAAHLSMDACIKQ